MGQVAVPPVQAMTFFPFHHGLLMLQHQMWQEINLLAKKLYLASPMKTLVIPKYRHSDGSLYIKKQMISFVWYTEQTKLKIKENSEIL